MQRIYIFCILNFFTATSQAANYCNTISVPEGLERNGIFLISPSNDECANWNRHRTDSLALSIAFPGANIPQSKMVQMNRTHRKSPGEVPEFISYDRQRQKYYFNRTKHGYAIDSWPIYQSRMETILKHGGVSLHSEMKSGGNSKEGYVMLILTYRDAADNAWKEGFFSFYRSEKLSVWYWTPLLSSKKPEDMALLSGMTRIFSSMRYASAQ